MTKRRDHFLPGSTVDVLFCELSGTWLRGTVLGVLDSGLVVSKLTDGLTVTRTRFEVKHVDPCPHCCV